jgi:hypothetical protein
MESRNTPGCGFINGSTVICLCYSGFTVNTIYIHVDSNYTLIEAGF